MTERLRVGEVLTLLRRPVRIDQAADYKFLGVSASGGGFFRKPPTPGSAIRPGSAFAVEPGDFVYSRLFAWRGSFEIASAEEAACVVSGEFPTFAVDISKTDARWLRYWFLSETGLREVRDRSAGSTPGSRNRLREDRFLGIDVPFPSIDEQTRVADQLDRLHAAVSDLRHRFGRASALIGALAISSALRPDLTDRSKARAGWRRVRLDEVLVEHNGITRVQGDESYDVAGVYSFGRGMFRRGAVEGSQTSYKVLHRLHAGQLVMSRLKAWEGAIAVVPSDLDGWFLSPEFPTFAVDAKRADTNFVGSLLTSEQFWGRLGGASRGIGARRERVHAARLLEQEIDLPPINVQRSVAGTIWALRNSADRRSDIARRVDALFPAALNEAFASLN